MASTVYMPFTSAQELSLKTFDYTEHRPHNIEQDLDPDHFFFNNIISQCNYFTEEQFKNIPLSEQTFSIIHFNSRSLRKNFSRIKDCLKVSTKQFSVIAVSETWLRQDQEDSVQLEGYDFFPANRLNVNKKRGGGVALYVKSTFQCEKVKNMTISIENVMDCVTIEIISKKSKNIMVSCVYRAPESNIHIFENKFTEMFDAKRNKLLFVCGDFNIDFLNPHEQPQITQFINSVFCMGLYPVITHPSRIAKNSATLIDNILTNVNEGNINGGLFISDISDHLPVFAVFESTIEKNEHNETRNLIRKITDENIEDLRKDLMCQSWNGVYVEDLDKSYDSFITTISQLYDKYCPLVARGSKRNIDKPWITKGLQNACKKKNLLYKQFLKSRTQEAENKYKKYKNKLISIMRFCKKQYYMEKLEKNKNNTKSTWKVLNELIKNKKSVKEYPSYFYSQNDTIMQENKPIANQFNEHFVKVGESLAKSIASPPNTSQERVRNVISESMFVQETTEKELHDIVSHFKGKRSSDWNGFDMSLIKNIIDCIVKPLKYICNLSLMTGQFPTKMKVAKVIPLFKSGDKHTFSNYRPISLLPQLSKILEKVFANRLTDFILKHKILCEQQYGFRTNRTTSLALMDFVEQVSNAIDLKQYTIGVFLDLQKAFDTIDHTILLSKLQGYGIRGLAHNWVKSYLENRKQYVNINNTNSHFSTVTCGVPQGSVLGPLLFLLYINDLSSVSSKLKCILFADDTTVFCSGDNLEQLLDTVEKELQLLKQWFDLNKLSLHVGKTKCIIFGKKKRTHNKKLTINSTEIEIVSETKFLGTIIDENLNWKSHIKYIQSKISKSIAIMYKAEYCLCQKSLLILYYSLIAPYMTYCIEIWGNTYKSNTTPIFLLQKKAIRIISKKPYKEPTHPLFINLNILKFKDLVNFITLQTMYNAKNESLPPNVQRLFKMRENKHNLRGVLLFEKPKARTTLKTHCVSVKGVDIWNKCPVVIRKSNSPAILKKLYKKNILTHYLSMNV